MDDTLAASFSKKASAEKGDGVCCPRLPDRQPRRPLKVAHSFFGSLDDGLPVLLFSSPIERMHIADEAYPVGPVARGLCSPVHPLQTPSPPSKSSAFSVKPR